MAGNTSGRQSTDCIRFLRKVKEKGKLFTEFRSSVTVLQDEAFRGLDEKTLRLVIQILKSIDIGTTNCIALIKCMVPKYKIDDVEIRNLISWMLAVPLPVTSYTMLIHWLIGCWEYQLLNRNSVYIFYDSFFFLLLKQEKLESPLARLIYLMTKPEDVTRRQVSRLLRLNNHYRTPRKHLTALLSLFKSYKPEYVPEKIPAINVQSIWKPIPDSLREGFEQARNRIMMLQAQQTNEQCYDWSVFSTSKTAKKNQELLVPSVAYFNIGSNLFKNNIKKSIFDISDAKQLGKFDSTIELPCNATSLLTNLVGYHLLTYTDIEYQQRFMHNLYSTLWRSFIFENGRFSTEEMDRLLNLTVEFCKYMQHGISMVTYFISEYLSYGMDEYNTKLLSLMEWTWIPELQDFVMQHLKIMFYGSSVKIKCKIIKTLRILLLNLFVMSDNGFKDKPFPFLGQPFVGNFNESINLIENVSRQLIVAALNIHTYNSTVISEALSFYEQINVLKVSTTISFITLAPSAVVYGSFVTNSCALLSRICALLLQNRKYFREHTDQNSIRSIIKQLIVYAEDLVSALWYDNCFTNRHANNRYFLKSLSDDVIKNSSRIKLDSLFNIRKHYAMLPYFYVLSTTGFKIRTKEDACRVSAHYYEPVNQFLVAFLGN